MKMSNIESQKQFKPKISEVISSLLDGENLIVALEFIEYLKENKMSAQWANVNTWKVVSKGKAICYIKLNVDRKSGAACYPKLVDSNDSKKASWVILPSVAGFDNYIIHHTGYEEIMANKKEFDMMQAKVRRCTDCGNTKNCAPGINITFWGKELNNRCKFFAVPFLDPNTEELECIKKLINIYRKFIG